MFSSLLSAPPKGSWIDLSAVSYMMIGDVPSAEKITILLSYRGPAIQMQEGRSTAKLSQLFTLKPHWRLIIKRE